MKTAIATPDDFVYHIVVQNTKTKETETHNIKANNPDDALHGLYKLLKLEKRNTKQLKVVKVMEI